MALITITRGPWVINTALITSTVRLADNVYNVVAGGIGYTLTLAEALQLGVQNLAPPLSTGLPYTVTSPFSAYNAILTQAGVADPTAATLLNQVGAIVWTRSSAGVYVGTLAGAFPAAKTVLDIQIADGSTGQYAQASRTGADTIEVDVFDAAGAAADLVGDAVLKLQIYP